MEAVLDSQWDAGRAIAVVLVIGANYIKCERKTKGSSSARRIPKKTEAPVESELPDEIARGARIGGDVVSQMEW